MKIEIPTKSSIKKLVYTMIRKELNEVEKRLARLDNRVFYGEKEVNNG